MIRFPNPGSTLENFVAVFVAAFERYHGQVVDLDDIVEAVVASNLATSSGHMGKEAAIRSKREDRSRDPLFNQLKMYAELFKSLGLLHSTEALALNYTFTLLGEQLVAAKREWRELFREAALGIVYPNHVVNLHGSYDLRPFATILQTMLACDGGMTRDEMIIGPLSAESDRNVADREVIANKVLAVRSDPELANKTLEEVKTSRGVQINTLRNYTRWPIAVLRDLGWTEKYRQSHRKSDRTFEIHRLTPLGICQAQRLSESVDVRVDQVDSLTFDQKRAFARKSHFSMMERSGFDIRSVLGQLQAESNILNIALKELNIPEDKEILFSPFQSLSVSDISAIFPMAEKLYGKTSIEKMVDGKTIGRGGREDLFVKPNFVDIDIMQKGKGVDKIRAELEALMDKFKSMEAATDNFVKSRETNRKTQFYPLVAHLFQIIGFRSSSSRAGVNYQRWDACIWLNKNAIPIEIKSPAEELFLSNKAIRQAIENKVILLARGNLKTKRELTTLIVGYKIPSERADMSTLIEDVYKTFGFKIGVIDLRTLSYLAIRAIKDSVTIDGRQISNLKGFLDV